MRIKYTDLAKSHLKGIANYYNDIGAAKAGKSIILNIQQKVNVLKHQPKLGKVDHLNTTRKTKYYFLVINHYKVIYCILDSLIYIVFIFDTRQDPSKLEL